MPIDLLVCCIGLVSTSLDRVPTPTSPTKEKSKKTATPEVVTSKDHHVEECFVLPASSSL